MSRLSRHKVPEAKTNGDSLRGKPLRKPKPASGQEFDVDGWEPSLLERMRKAMRGPRKS